MRALLGTGAALVLLSAGASADSTSLAGSLWRCTRASDQSRFVITFYPGGGVGGGELHDGEVSPYIFDASRIKEGEWPGRWDQTGRRFTWSFPDQNMRIAGAITAPGQAKAQLMGTETASGVQSSISCTGLTKLPRIGEGLVIPRDNRFIDLEDGEGELKVPAGISLRPQD
ncbi:hypothetical protein DC522_15670 [Microvirga sp. KLBC 81]|uniref:hypothetical protein n=1 Tax=Microvirga sp. KLBC 81 TaxID=1862707 RepID=UPI000D51A755|nr:hypothetical protein [Microvirga sp. KLBC 81]PVE23445.1 hypothetical protein DC522_15670 [Microvirga sp. KLBC 81]